MRKRFQKGSVTKVDGSWIAQWWEDGHRRKRTLGRVSKMTKTDAVTELTAILAPINGRSKTPSARCSFKEFVEDVYFPFYRRKWKRTTTATNEDRISRHLVPEFGDRTVGSFQRDELQDVLDRKAATGLSFSIVAHLRWDLRQIFRMAVTEGYINRNPAELLFTPRECPRPNTPVMTIEEVKQLLSVLDIREQLISKLAIVAGMRPGEIFGLKWGRLESEYANVQQRVYRGDVDSPKTPRSVRWAALADGLLATIKEWRALSIDTSADAWVFPSEKLTTPLSKDNCWRRHFKPKLEAIELGWVNFQVMRKTHNSVMADIGVDPQIRADQMGHAVDVNQNVYTKRSLAQRREAVNALEAALGIM